jgi:hypothetical protein
MHGRLTAKSVTPFGKSKKAVSAVVGLLLLISTAALSRIAWAQAVYGTLFGTVTDSAGAVVPNATVTIRDTGKGTSSTTTTNASGDYRAEHLIPDTYAVDVIAPGFKKSTVPSVIVNADTAPQGDGAGYRGRPVASDGENRRQHHLQHSGS